MQEFSPQWGWVVVRLHLCSLADVELKVSDESNQRSVYETLALVTIVVSKMPMCVRVSNPKSTTNVYHLVAAHRNCESQIEGIYWICLWRRTKPSYKLPYGGFLMSPPALKRSKSYHGLSNSSFQPHIYRIEIYWLFFTCFGWFRMRPHPFFNPLLCMLGLQTIALSPIDFSLVDIIWSGRSTKPFPLATTFRFFSSPCTSCYL